MAGRVTGSHKWSDSRHSHSDGHGRPHAPTRARARSLLCFLLGVGCNLGPPVPAPGRAQQPSLHAPPVCGRGHSAGGCKGRGRKEGWGALAEAAGPWCSPHPGSSLCPPFAPESSQASTEQGFVTREQLAAIARRLASNGTIIMTVSNRGGLLLRGRAAWHFRRVHCSSLSPLPPCTETACLSLLRPR